MAKAFALPREVTAALEAGPVIFAVEKVWAQRVITGREISFGPIYFTGVFLDKMRSLSDGINKYQHSYKAEGRFANVKAGEFITITAAMAGDFH